MYKVVRKSAALDSEDLNGFFKDGWELISAYCIMGELQNVHYYYFKKVPKTEVQKPKSGADYCEYGDTYYD